MTRTLQRADLQRHAHGLNTTQVWMLSEIADDINAMTETGDMSAAEAKTVLDRLAGILKEIQE